MKSPALPASFAVLLLALPPASPAAGSAALPVSASRAAATAPLELALAADDVLATGNEWLALPEIRASDGALLTFNVLSMRERGLLQVAGDAGRPALAPTFTLNGKPAALGAWHWSLQGYWIPSARQQAQGIDYTLSWCAPPGQRAAFLRLTATNRGQAPARVTLGLRASFGSLARVTYLPVPLRGSLRVGPAPWVAPGEAFSYVTDDTRFAWALVHPGAEAQLHEAPMQRMRWCWRRASTAKRCSCWPRAWRSSAPRTTRARCASDSTAKARKRSSRRQWNGRWRARAAPAMPRSTR